MEEIEVVYKDGVFRPLKQTEGTRGVVITVHFKGEICYGGSCYHV